MSTQMMNQKIADYFKTQPIQRAWPCSATSWKSPAATIQRACKTNYCHRKSAQRVKNMQFYFKISKIRGERPFFEAYLQEYAYLCSVKSICNEY